MTLFDEIEPTKKDTYQTLAALSQGIYKEKGSKFLAYAKSVYTEEDIKTLLNQVKKEHPKARHHCYAYRLGMDKKANYRANDDGEPSGTAGKPILGQIDSYELTNVMVIIVRYFGGTKLGVSGLIRAYKTATKIAFEEADLITKKIMCHFELSFDYISMNAVMKIIKKEDLQITKQFYEDTYKIQVPIRQRDKQRIIAKLMTVDSLVAKYLYNT